MFAALMGAGMISVTSCADYDEDVKTLQQQVDANTSVNDALQIQVDGMQAQIQELEKALSSMKSCNCGDVDSKIAEALSKAISSANLTTAAEVAAAIDKALKELELGPTEDEVQKLIELYHKDHPSIQASDVKTLIEQYLKENPGLSESDVEAIVKAYIEKHPSSSLTENDVKSIVETYVSQLQLVTKSDIESIISTAIAQAMAKCDCLSNENAAAIITGVIEKYMQEHNYTLDAVAVENICNTAINNAQIIKDLKSAIDTLQGAMNTVQGNITDINNTFVTVNQSIKEAADKAKEALEKANANSVKLGTLETTVNNLNTLYISLDSKVTETWNKAVEALSKAQSNYDEIETLKGIVENLQLKGYDDTELRGRIETLESQLKTLPTKDELEDQINNIKNVLVNDAKSLAQEALKDANKYTDTKIGDLKDAYKLADKKLQDQINGLQDQIDEINKQIKLISDITKTLGKVENALTKLITGIELQGSKNPAFGSFALPVGITSNVLLAYYGTNTHDTYFPAVDDRDLVYAGKENWITEADYERIGFDPFTWYNGRQLDGGSTLLNDEGNAGKLYLTLNPSNVDFTGTQLKLVNSLGEESPITLGALKKSEDKLTFGQTRATKTYFYEAPATVDESRLGTAAFGFDEQIDVVLKDIKKNGLGNNISDLGQAVLNQLNGTLDAYAVQATWNDELGEHTVTSNYNVAAAAIKPLSYNTMAGVNFQLPMITPLSEMKIDLKEIIDPSKFNFDIPAINTNFGIQVRFSNLYIDPATGDVWSDITVTGTDSYEKMPVKIMDADDFQSNKEVVDDIVKILNDRAITWGAQLEAEFAVQLKDNLEKMQDQINDAVAQVGGKLEGAVNDLVETAQNKLNSLLSKGDKFINELNKLIESINDNFFGDGNPNLRLQGEIFYSDRYGLLHPMSTAKGIPTIMTGNGEAIELNLTSYTGELLAPAFKKFVAVTNVYKNGKDADSNPELMQALKTANNVKGFNEVISGDHYAAVFHPTVKGATYEIVYSSLDFHGYISQRKFYVHVK